MEFKRCMELFNALFTVPMLLIYVDNLTSFAALPELFVGNDCINYVDQIINRAYMTFHALITIVIWMLASQLHANAR